MFIGDMNKKREQAMAKVRNAIGCNNGRLCSAQVSPVMTRDWRKQCGDAGVKMLERTIRRWRWHADTGRE